MTIDEMINKLETLSIEKYKKADMLDEVVNKKQFVDMCDIDLIEATLCRQKSDDYEQLSEWLKELKTHREAWEKVTEIISKWKDSVGGVIVAKDAFSDILDLIIDFRPKEGESNGSSNN